MQFVQRRQDGKDARKEHLAHSHRRCSLHVSACSLCPSELSTREDLSAVVAVAVANAVIKHALQLVQAQQ
jgi:hypothetical protein